MQQRPQNQTPANTISVPMMCRAMGYAVALLSLVVGAATLMSMF